MISFRKHVAVLCWVSVAGVLSGGLLAAAAQQPAPAQPAATAPAQLPGADPGPPPPAVFQPLIPPAQLAFLSGFAGQPAKALMKDQRFKALMKQVIPVSLYHYGHDLSLIYAVQLVMDRSAIPIEVAGGRFVTITGEKDFMHGRALLWFDLQEGQALGAFFFHPTNGEPTPTLTVFSKQFTDKTLYMGQLPPVFEIKLVEWSAAEGIPTVTPRYFIPANGKKYALLHDEDYCATQPGSPPPQQEQCAQMNAAAADADMDAAYFMKLAFNDANATARFVEPEQVAWLNLRQRTCGAGLPCRIAMTRQRVQVIIGRPGQPVRN